MGSRTLAGLNRLLVTALLGVWSFPQSLPDADQSPIFREVAQEVGLDFHHFIGATGEYFFPEIMGAGVGLFDYDGDGDLDIYFLQGTMLDKAKKMFQSRFPFPGQAPPRNRLFRNDLIEKGELHFSDVTGEAGVGHEGYGMGIAVGDYDDDGHLDFYVTNFGSNVLYRNTGDGAFTDVAREAGVDDPRYSASAAFLDYDSDGDLDLFLTNYVSFTVKGNKVCRLAVRDYCAPNVYEPVPDRLFRNEGNGQFTDVTEEAGLGTAFGAGLGVIAVDFNFDQRVDIYVANDEMPNQLWVNKGDGTFEDLGLISGTAYNMDGVAEAGMGVTAADFDGDGDEDLFVTHNQRQTNTLYLNGGRAVFRTPPPDLVWPSRASPILVLGRSGSIMITMAGWTCSWPTGPLHWIVGNRPTRLIPLRKRTSSSEATERADIRRLALTLPGRVWISSKSAAELPLVTWTTMETSTS